jgi:hypothetical protein
VLMHNHYNEKTAVVQHYTTQLAAIEENTQRYSTLLDKSHRGGCCRKCKLATVTRFGLVRCKPKNKTVNGLSICDKYDGELHEQKV